MGGLPEQVLRSFPFLPACFPTQEEALCSGEPGLRTLGHEFWRWSFHNGLVSTLMGEDSTSTSAHVVGEDTCPLGVTRLGLPEKILDAH